MRGDGRRKVRRYDDQRTKATLQGLKMFVCIGPAGPWGHAFPPHHNRPVSQLSVTPISRWQDGVHSGPGLARQVPLTQNSIPLRAVHVWSVSRG